MRGRLPLDALAFDERDAVVSRANERAAALRERGWAAASVLGVSEQGGHHVVQVMKYGVGGSMHEALASTGEVEWLDAVKMAGPVSVGVLGLAAAGAVAGLAVESSRQRAAEAEAAAASAGTFNPLLDEENIEGEEGADDEAREVVEESALQAALRRRNALRTRKGATPLLPQLPQWRPYPWRSTTGTTPRWRMTTGRRMLSRAS